MKLETHTVKGFPFKHIMSDAREDDCGDADFKILKLDEPVV